jgi:hypothetical protein
MPAVWSPRLNRGCSWRHRLGAPGDEEVPPRLTRRTGSAKVGGMRSDIGAYSTRPERAASAASGVAAWIVGRRSESCLDAPPLVRTPHPPLHGVIVSTVIR